MVTVNIYLLIYLLLSLWSQYIMKTQCLQRQLLKNRIFCETSGLKGGFLAVLDTSLICNPFDDATAITM